MSTLIVSDEVACRSVFLRRITSFFYRRDLICFITDLWLNGSIAIEEAQKMLQ